MGPMSRVFFRTVDDVMVGLDDCGRSVFGVMGELQPIVPELDFFLAWPVNFVP